MSKKLFEGGSYLGDYKPLMPKYYPLQYQKYIEEEVGLLRHKLGGSEVVLEAGVGIGRLIPIISPLVSKLVGVDNSDYMIEKSREVASQFKNVEIYKANLEEIVNNYPENFFDYSLILWNTLGNVANEVDILKSLAYVTKKEIVITVHKKGAIAHRKNWYETVGIKVKQVDKDETVYTEDGLRSKSYNFEDLSSLASLSGLKVKEQKDLAGVVIWITLSK